ncbi:uncharacterized protein [Salminus brasiliensis]|uniref:uncharacterized protein n=1 Tax=Salminus brasiliensis TaxID=930266 RepID=UPI003B82FCA9
MPRSREIPEELRKQVVEAYQSGKGYKLISKALGLSKTTIRAILRKWKRFGTVMNLPRSGRPPKISISTRREIIREVTKNPCTTSKDVQAALAAVNISVHDSTIRRILGVHGRPTLSGLQDVMALRSSSDEEKGIQFPDRSDGFRKDVKVENDQQDSMNDGRGGAMEEECCDETLGQDIDDCGGAGDASEKCIDGDEADSDSSDDIVYKYDDDDDDAISYDNGGGGDDNDGESCDEGTEEDFTPQ